MGIEQYIAPKFAITHKGNTKHQMRILSLSYMDYEKDNVDMLSLTLAPHSKLPSFGDRIELLLGRSALNFMGAFYVSSIKENYLQHYTIEATSIDYTKEFKIIKSRSFESLSYAQILQSIARENNLKAKLDFKYQDSITHLEQNDESDSALCKRLADELDCSFSVKNDTLIFLDRDKSFDRRTYTINARDTLSLEIEYFAQKHYKSVELTYQDESGNTRNVKVGKGVPIYRMSREAKDDNHALQMATTRLQALNAKKTKGHLSAIGRVLFAGGYLSLTKDSTTSTHIITQVTHHLNSQSWNMNVEFESER
ncbi:phage late control D family protein [Helicobacter sp. MIT 05-5293]|uniref:phage late control D family protein n=1 Tax=Helicobacter sp. MIT 05-5293 TaxID=1548149 RepID=UPI00051DB63E|nr:contractile injection system protein, VgrG/Pvc8 family [Helicobacter sp. MIT 05-5293]TLD80189.1 phage late control D family protein [Helicobacter sp. MIT 05-5293]